MLPNAEFLRLSMLYFANSEPKSVRAIRQIKTRPQEWTRRDVFDAEAYYEFGEIRFVGPFALGLLFKKNRIEFFQPCVNYWSWFEYNYQNEQAEAWRTEWRRYMHAVVKQLGGNKVIYLASQTIFLERYIYHEGTFEEMEQDLLINHGKPKQTFNEVADDFKHAYFIDGFTNVDWNKYFNLEELLPEPNDESTIDFNQKELSDKSKLMNFEVQERQMQHKRVGDKVRFFHIFRNEGLLGIHEGEVGGEENLEVRLDKYAPFTYDDLKAKADQEGYSWIDKETMRVDVPETNDKKEALRIDYVLNEFAKELFWKGIGEHRLDMGGIRSEYFEVVDKNEARKLLSRLLNKHGLEGKLELVCETGDDRLNSIL